MSEIPLPDSQGDGGTALSLPQTVSSGASGISLTNRVANAVVPLGGRLRTSLSLMWARRAWLLVIIPYLAAWWIPTAWGASFWFDPASAMSFQPLVPLGAFLLFWCRRVEFWQIWTELGLLYAPENSRRRGHMAWLFVGCALLMVSHIAHLPGVAILSLLLIGFGILRQMIGIVMLRALSVPLGFLLLMIPPPETVITAISRVTGTASAYAVAGLLKIVGKNAAAQRGLAMPILKTDDLILEMSTAQTGGAVLMASVVLSLWLALMVRANLVGTFMLVVAGFIFSMSLSSLRFFAMALVAPQNAELADSIGRINPYVFVALSFVLTFLVGRAVRFGRRGK